MKKDMSSTRTLHSKYLHGSFETKIVSIRDDLFVGCPNHFTGNKWVAVVQTCSFDVVDV